MPLTPNNREEHWLQGMVDGSTNLEPNKRREYWYKEIVDAIGSGGGGGTGGGVTVLTATVSDGTVTIPCTAAELYSYMQSSIVYIKYDVPDDDLVAHKIVLLYKAEYEPMETHLGLPEYRFVSYDFEIECETGTSIPSWSIG